MHLKTIRAAPSAGPLIHPLNKTWPRPPTPSPSPPRPAEKVSGGAQLLSGGRQRSIGMGDSSSRCSRGFHLGSLPRHRRGQRPASRRDAEIEQIPRRSSDPQAPLFLFLCPSPPWPASRRKSSRRPPEIGAAAHLFMELPPASSATETPHRGASPADESGRLQTPCAGAGCRANRQRTGGGKLPPILLSPPPRPAKEGAGKPPPRPRLKRALLEDLLAELHPGVAPWTARKTTTQRRRIWPRRPDWNLAA
jgi:hypothetical protein